MTEKINQKAMLDEPDDKFKMLMRELRAAERNVEVLANLCDYMSKHVSAFTRMNALSTLHHIEHLRQYQLDPEHPEHGARWVYERPILWRDQARYEDDLHRLQTQIEQQQKTISQLSPKRLGPQPETEEQRKEAERELDQLIQKAGAMLQK